jgi:hypothetical protein
MRIQDVDRQVALEWLAQPQAASLIAKYRHEADSEIADDLVKLAMYCKLRSEGVSPLWATISACRRAPGARNVDRHFCEHARHRMNALGPQLPKMLKLAHQAGVNTHGKFYVGGLGRYTDQFAWVSCADDVLATAKLKPHLNITGAVNKAAAITDVEPKRVPMADDIMASYERKYLRDPEVRAKVKTPKQRRELREKILHTHAKVK